MIKFPTTVSEYTDGKLWHEGVNESIARRLLSSLRSVEDQNEVCLRKIYLAYFYLGLGEYRIATKLAKSVLLENKCLEDALLLVKILSVKEHKFDEMFHTINLINAIYHGRPPKSFFIDIDIDDDELILADFLDNVKDTRKGQIIFDGAIAKYYQNDSLIFSTSDKNYDAMIKDAIARNLMSEGIPSEAIELLGEIKYERLKTSTKLRCYETLVKAYSLLEKYDEAYGYCEFLIKCGVFLPEMVDIYLYLYQNGDSGINGMREFFAKYDAFDIEQLGDIHSLTSLTDDVELWNMVYKNNPIDESYRSENAYILRGMLAFNNRDYDLAKKIFMQATALYGHFGKSWLYRYYVDCYVKKLNKPSQVSKMPSVLYTFLIDDLYELVGKRLYSKLKRAKAKGDLAKDYDEYMIEIDSILTLAETNMPMLTELVNKLYVKGTERERFNRAIVDSEYRALARAICLANFMLYSNNKKFVLGKFVYDNPFGKILKSGVEGERQPFAYGVAIYLALDVIYDIENRKLKKISEKIKKIYAQAKGDYSEVSPLAVFGVLLAFFDEAELPSYIKRSDIKKFAQIYIEDVFSQDATRAFAGDDEVVFEFIRFCTSLT